MSSQAAAPNGWRRPVFCERRALGPLAGGTLSRTRSVRPPRDVTQAPRRPRAGASRLAGHARMRSRFGHHGSLRSATKVATKSAARSMIDEDVRGRHVSAPSPNGCRSTPTTLTASPPRGVCEPPGNSPSLGVLPVRRPASASRRLRSRTPSDRPRVPAQMPRGARNRSRTSSCNAARTALVARPRSLEWNLQLVAELDDVGLGHRQKRGEDLDTCEPVDGDVDHRLECTHELRPAVRGADEVASPVCAPNATAPRRGASPRARTRC